MAFVTNIEQVSLDNTNFRKVLYTDQRAQLVVMSLLPREEIGMEVHQMDQFIRVEKGTGKSILNGQEFPLADGVAVLVPAGTNHNIINTSETESMKLYTLYTPPNHKDGTVHVTKADAERDEGEHFDGKTTE